MSTVICHTDGCGNAEQPIELTLSWEEAGETYHVDTVVCGPCGQPITDIQPPLDGEPDTPPEPEPQEAGQ